MSDLDVLALAAAQNRILVTHDFRTMPRHFAEFLATGVTSPGGEGLDYPVALRARVPSHRRT